MRQTVRVFQGLVCVVLWCSSSEAAERVLEVQGQHLGNKAGMVVVARDQQSWEAVKLAVGKPQMLPKGFPNTATLDLLNHVDFEKEMIVAFFWGEMAFAGHGEKCWIDEVSEEKTEVLVECQANLWGGAVYRSYRAWPFHAKIVPRSDLPIRFTQKTKLLDVPEKEQKVTPLGTVKADEWKQFIPLPKGSVAPKPGG